MGTLNGQFYIGASLEDKTCKKIIEYYGKRKFLRPGMRIEAVFGQFFIGSALGIICTPEEALYLHPGKLGPSVIRIPYQSIASISVSQDLGVGTKLDIGMHGTDGVRLELTGKPDQTNQIIQFLQGKSAQNKANATPDAKTDVVDEIRRYSELKEQGIISAEEFESKKKQLLGL